VALWGGSPRVGVTDHRALWSPDLPHRDASPGAAARPGSVHPRERGPTAIHLGLPLLAASCGLPASIGRAALNRSRRPAPLTAAWALLTLLRVGFTEPPQSPAALVVSYTTVSPLPLPSVNGRQRRSVFCGTVPRVTPGRCYRPPCRVEPGPSSPDRGPARPPGWAASECLFTGAIPLLLNAGAFVCCVSALDRSTPL